MVPHSTPPIQAAMEGKGNKPAPFCRQKRSVVVQNGNRMHGEVLSACAEGDETPGEGLVAPAGFGPATWRL